MKISYIFHSGFLIELDEVVLIFDYYKGELPEFDKNKDIYIFSSHRHHDHFTTKIFHLLENTINCNYILSNDIELNARYLSLHGLNEEVMNHTTMIGKNETLELTGTHSKIGIGTLASTDEGVAFIVTCEGKTIYHAGDLNWWCWPGEVEEVYEEMTARFVNEMKKIEDRHFDVAFLVLDPRQEDLYWWGFDYFMRATDTKWAIPMHCWKDYSIIDRFMEHDTTKEYRNHILKVVENVVEL